MADLESPPEEPTALAEPPAPPDGVLIRVEYAEDGNVNLTLAPLGSVRTTEIATILELAYKQARLATGLDG